MWNLANKVGPLATMIEVTSGRYYHWHDASGAELWLQVNHENELIGMNPHFAGNSHFPIGLTKRIIRPDDTALDGAIHAWANPSTDELESGYYPFVFDVPNLAQHPNLEIPQMAHVQISAFAHNVTLYDSLDEHENSSSDTPTFASQSFIPSGLFNLEEGSIDPPQSYAIFTGHIIQAEEKVNTLTDNTYIWSSVDTLGGIFDVVIDSALVSNLPKVGGILSGTFWLSGTLKF
ncbi:MAG: hypothetical protein AAF614_29895 [Chloroflexota bacterium]